MKKQYRDILIFLLFALVLVLVIGNFYLIKFLTTNKPLKQSDISRLASAEESNILIPSSGTYWGIYAKPKGGEGRQAAITNLEAQVGRKFAIDHQYYRWDDVVPSAYDEWTASQGRIPLISWASHKNDSTPIRWDSIARGDQDTWIIAQADRLKTFGKPVFFGFQHEPENEAQSGSYGTATDYRNAWIHIVEKFRERGANNVIFWWILTAYTYKTNPSLANDLYPGDNVVDWIGADPYNFFTKNGKWNPMETVATGFYNWGKQHNKPLALGEWGTEEDPAVPGRKADWFIEVQSLLKTWPEVKAVAYFNSDNSYPWWIDTSTSSLQAFTLVGHDPYFNPEIPTVNPTSVPPTNTPVPTNTPTPTPVPPTATPTPTNTPTPTPTNTPTPTPTNTPTPSPTNTPTPIPTNTPTPTLVPVVKGSVVKIWAYGTPSNNIYPTMRLIINGVIVRTWDDVRPNLFGFAREYDYYNPQNIGPRTIIRVAFINDKNSPKLGDRNLNVNRINVDGVDYESKQMLSTGTWSKVGGCNDGYKFSSWLACNGYFEYPIK